MKDPLWGIKPVMCGPKMDTSDYLLWKTHHQQLWRFEVYTCPEPVLSKPYRPQEHSTPPRPKDLVQVGARVAVIVRIDRSNDEAHVWFFKDNEPDSFPLDLFETNRGRVRWIIHQM